MNQIKEIFENAGYTFNSDNRSMYTRAINKVIETGRVKIKIAKRGEVWFNDSNYEWNFSIYAAGFNRRGKIKPRDLTVARLLLEVGRLLQDDRVKEKIKSSVHIPGPCAKCNGAGIIREFLYYADGICFDCLGVGMDPELLKVEIKD